MSDESPLIEDAALVEAAIGIVCAGGGRVVLDCRPGSARVRVLVQGGRALGWREASAEGSPLRALFVALERFRREVLQAPKRSLVCDRGCIGFVRIDRRDLDVTTTGHTDRLCAMCNAPMVLLR